MNRLKNLFLALLLACLLGIKARAAGFEYVRVDGRSPNPEVVVNNRNPVISWKRAGYTDNVKKDAFIMVSTESSFTILFSSFSEKNIDKDTYRLTYSSTPLEVGTTYYIKLEVIDENNISSGLSDSVIFFTVDPAVDIEDGTIDLKIDWNNPFYSGEVTKIRYSIPQGIDQKVFLAVYSPSGRMVKILVNNEVKISGVIHTEYWDGKDESNSMVGSGIYLVHLMVGDVYKTVNVCFIK